MEHIRRKVVHTIFTSAPHACKASLPYGHKGGKHAVKRILVVEDEISIANLISYNLEQAGYNGTSFLTLFLRGGQKVSRCAGG